MSSILPTHCKACYATIFVKVFFSFIIKFALSENEHHFSRRPIKSRIDLARHTHTRFVSNGKHEHKLVHGTENDCCSNGYVAHSKNKGKWFEPSESVGFGSVNKFKFFLNINADRFEYLVRDCLNESLYQSCSFCEPGYGRVGLDCYVCVRFVYVSGEAGNENRCILKMAIIAFFWFWAKRF